AGRLLTRETGGAAGFETNGVVVGEAGTETVAAVCVGATVCFAVAFLFSACEQLMTNAAANIEAVTESNGDVLITGKPYLTHAGTEQLSPSVSKTPSPSSSRYER